MQTNYQEVFQYITNGAKQEAETIKNVKVGTLGEGGRVDPNPNLQGHFHNDEGGPPLIWR